MAKWKEYQVSELLDSKSLAIGDGYRAKNSELSNTGLPFARAGNINEGFDFTNADYFPAEDISKVGEKISRVGDIVFTSKGTVGRFAFVDESAPKFVYSPQLCYWRSLDKSLIHPRFLLFQHVSPKLCTLVQDFSCYPLLRMLEVRQHER